MSLNLVATIRCPKSLLEIDIIEFGSSKLERFDSGVKVAESSTGFSNQQQDFTTSSVGHYIFICLFAYPVCLLGNKVKFAVLQPTHNDLKQTRSDQRS